MLTSISFTAAAIIMDFFIYHIYKLSWLGSVIKVTVGRMDFQGTIPRMGRDFYLNLYLLSNGSVALSQGDKMTSS
jgi:hypothetical protein